MQSINDDMDELFRKAAADYPLKTDGADWDAVMLRLQTPNASNPATSGRKRKQQHWLWLLLLLPLAFVGHLARRDNSSGTAVAGDVQRSVAQISATPVAADAATPVVHTTTATVASHNTVTPVAPATEQQKIVAEKRSVSLSAQATFAKPLSYHTYSNNGNSNHTPVSNRRVKANINSVKTQTISTVDNDVFTDHGATVMLTRETKDPETITQAQSVAAHSAATVSTSLQKEDTVTAIPEMVKDDKKMPAQKGFYAGIVLSPDFSTVKMQQMSKVGYNAGILIGYRFSARWSVETGALWEKKYYYSKGEYFNTGKINLPSGTVIDDVKGWCNMIDIPVLVKYNFIIRKDHSWFANAGLLSYIMNKESYTYKYTRYGNQYERGWDYKGSTRNWFSVMQLGFGYEHTLGRLGNLRVEPYIKLPVSGIGIGNLPVSSAGINIGILKSIR